MKLYVGYISALYFWRLREVEDFATFPRSKKRVLSDCCARKVDDDGRVPSSLYFGPGEKHLLVPESGMRVNRDEYCYHTWTGKLPERSLIELDGRHYVSSPEFCFFQMARTLSVAGLVQLGMELCGIYRLQPGAPAQHDCPPLTTPAKLSAFVEKCKGRAGYKKAKRALRWILAGAASPMETCCYERLCMPKALKGYGMPAPRPNGEMRLNEHQQRLAERSTSYGDLYWPDQDVSVEYFGQDDHTGIEDMNRDAKRNNALTSRNTRTYTITWDIYNDMDKFEEIAREVASALGYRIRQNPLESSLASWELAKELKEQERLTRLEED